MRSNITSYQAIVKQNNVGRGSTIAVSVEMDVWSQTNWAMSTNVQIKA